MTLSPVTAKQLLEKSQARVEALVREKELTDKLIALVRMMDQLDAEWRAQASLQSHDGGPPSMIFSSALLMHSAKLNVLQQREILEDQYAKLILECIAANFEPGPIMPGLKQTENGPVEKRTIRQVKRLRPSMSDDSHSATENLSDTEGAADDGSEFGCSESDQSSDNISDVATESSSEESFYEEERDDDLVCYSTDHSSSQSTQLDAPDSDHNDAQADDKDDGDDNGDDNGDENGADNGQDGGDEKGADDNDDGGDAGLAGPGKRKRRFARPIEPRRSKRPVKVTGANLDDAVQIASGSSCDTSHLRAYLDRLVRSSIFDCGWPRDAKRTADFESMIAECWQGTVHFHTLEPTVYQVCHLCNTNKPCSVEIVTSAGTLPAGAKCASRFRFVWKTLNRFGVLKTALVGAADKEERVILLREWVAKMQKAHTSLIDNVSRSKFKFRK